MHRGDAPGRFENGLHFLFQQRHEPVGRGHALRAGTILQATHQGQRGLRAHVGHDEQLFHFIPESAVSSVCPAISAGKPLSEAGAGARKTVLQLGKQPVAFIFLVLHVEGKGQTILKFRPEVLQPMIFHAVEPAAEVVQKLAGFVSGVSSARSRKARRFHRSSSASSPPSSTTASHAESLGSA